MSDAASVKLGLITAITDAGNSMPQPMVMQGRANMSMEDKAVPVAAGEMVITSDVNVVWELR
jgi:uncharacterized protein YggE